MSSDHLSLGPGAEFDTIRATLARWGAVARGTGDDAAVLEVPRGERLVVSTDTAVENVHFRRAWLSAEEIAYRAGAAALSDLAAMGATPLAMTIALTLPETWRAESMALADGIASVARETGTPIVGGDLTTGTELSLSVTALGTVRRPLSRGGAREGQAVWVTGRLGAPRLALEALERGLTPHPAHRARFAHPAPRLHEARWLAEHGVTAAIDCSDGVAADLGHVAAASRVRIVLDLDRLPCVSGATPDDAARSGEEYELLVTAPEGLDAGAFEREFGLPLTAVGRVERAGAGGATVETLRGGVPVPAPRGHDHFTP
ncbi:MAG TPA: thiamine-phosphate kinase [Gemmatimonadaceae bacterium]|nr:thiamine-phosphate kinase [Gemmatimonadaceae bacterium]